MLGVRSKSGARSGSGSVNVAIDTASYREAHVGSAASVAECSFFPVSFFKLSYSRFLIICVDVQSQG